MNQIERATLTDLVPELQPISVTEAPWGGLQAEWRFANAYGASVITLPGRVELAVLHHGGLCYSTPITDDVEIVSSPEELAALLRQIRDLEA